MRKKLSSVISQCGIVMEAYKIHQCGAHRAVLGVFECIISELHICECEDERRHMRALHNALAPHGGISRGG